MRGASTIVRPEPAEGPAFFQGRGKGKGFDKLGPNGFRLPGPSF